MKRYALLFLACSPALLPAQSTTLSSFVAADGGVDGSPLLVGITVAREGRYLGARWSSAVDARSTFGSERSPTQRVSELLMTEVDALLFPLGSRGERVLDPYLIAGAGLRLTRDATATGVGGLWSYGLGGRYPISGRLSAEAEARHRRPILPDLAAMPAGTAPGWELRAGMNLRVGRTAARAIPRTGPAAPVWSAPAPARVPAATGGARGARLAVAAKTLDSAGRLLGVRYRWGGNSPAEGFDCSGFVRYLFLQQGIELPRVSRDQARAGAPLPLDPRVFEPGDILAFASNGSDVDHIAIYAGEGRIIHSSASGGGVRYDELSSRRGAWYLRHMVSARRVIDAPAP